jgi:hypothetical protein
VEGLHDGLFELFKSGVNVQWWWWWRRTLISSFSALRIAAFFSCASAHLLTL